jgi:hypothetical protein
MISRRSAIGMAIAAMAFASIPSHAEDEGNPAALAKALSEASLSLAQGLRASESQGKPISGKFEIENEALQLSVYTMKESQFAEVIIDHNSGSIREAEPLTEDDDLADAKNQSEAMSKAKRSLEEVVAVAVNENAGYLAVSAMPKLDNGRPVAIVTLMKGGDVRRVTQGLE